MKFALVHDWVVNPGGSEEVLREVLAMYPGVLFTSQCDRSKFPWLEGVEVRTSFIQHLPFALSKHYLYAPLAALVYPRWDLSDFDVVLSDSHSFAHGVRKRAGALHVNYYHTPARSLWLPEIDPRASGWPFGLIASRLRKLDREASQRPDVILANSNTTAERVEKFYGRKAHKVVYPPVRTQKFADVARESDDEGYLMWGRLIEYKRVDLAISAARAVGFRLNVVGDGPLETRLKRLAEGLPNVRFHGRLSDAELKRLMSRSRAVLFPAYEDFGIVPVEAMAAALPVIAYGAGGAAESVTPECGVLMSEQSVEALIEAVRELESKEFDPEAIRRRAARFDESVFRSEYRSAVDSAIGEHFGSRR